MWENRENKHLARKFLIDQAVNHFPKDLPISYTGLPAEDCIFEKMLLKEFPLSRAILFERETAVFNKMSETASGIFEPGVAQLINDDVDKTYNFLHQIDFVYLDYCGPLTKRRLEIIEDAFMWMPEGGMLAFTFLLSREPKGIELNPNPSCAALPRAQLIQSRLKGLGLGFNLKVYPYRDSSPMGLFIITMTNSSGSSSEKSSVQIFGGAAPPKSKIERRGRRNPVSVDGIHFPSIGEGAEFMGLSRSVFRRRIDSKAYPTYFFI